MYLFNGATGTRVHGGESHSLRSAGAHQAGTPEGCPPIAWVTEAEPQLSRTTMLPDFRMPSVSTR